MRDQELPQPFVTTPTARDVTVPKSAQWKLQYLGTIDLG